MSTGLKSELANIICNQG